MGRGRRKLLRRRQVERRIRRAAIALRTRTQRTQPRGMEGHLSNEGMQVWLQYKALVLLYELLCTVRLRQAELGTSVD